MEIVLAVCESIAVGICSQLLHAMTTKAVKNKPFNSINQWITSTEHGLSYPLIFHAGRHGG